MCTVTFISRNQQIFITSNRDESPGRRAKGIASLDDTSMESVHFPLDESSGGSWISLSDSGKAVCLLNGAYESFIPNPPYRLSRGQIVIDAARSKKGSDYIADVDLHNVAPFTLIIFENQTLEELVWDGTQKHIQSLPVDISYIWSSATLYPPDVRAWRKSLFDQWMKETKNIDRESIIAFHQMANGDPGNGFVMNRNEVVKTLSITSIQLQQDAGSILHLELDADTREEIFI